MKRILIVAAVAACTLLAACVTPAKFDATEQIAYATLWQYAKRLEQACEKGQRSPAGERAIVGAMYDAVELLGAYIEYQEDTGSREILRAFMKLQDTMGDVSASSPGYCRASAINLQDAANRAMQVNGGRQR